jgi:tRNA A37 threonylcarbamoyladenosine modification protein TsaB
MNNARIVLSIETGVCGGSLSLIKNRGEIDSWIGREKVSKAEDVLEQAANLLKRNRVATDEINLVTISRGPGSAIGLRIGEALALGLRKSSQCLLKAVLILEAMAEESKHLKSSASAIPFGKNQIYWQVQSKEDEKEQCVGELRLSTFQSFLGEIKDEKINFLNVHQFLHKSLINDFGEECLRGIEVKPVVNLARKIGFYELHKQKISTRPIIK